MDEDRTTNAEGVAGIYGVRGSLWCSRESGTIFCGNTSLHGMEVDEGLIRQAVLTHTEILTFDADEIPGFTGAAALRRFEVAPGCHEIPSADKEIIEGPTPAIPRLCNSSSLTLRPPAIFSYALTN